MIASPLLNSASLQAFDVREFERRRPFPWQGIAKLLNDEAFARLRAEFPSPPQFVSHQDRERVHGQRPHNRLYLTLEDRPLVHRRRPGRIRGADLSRTWRAFLRALRCDKHYQRFAAQALGLPRLRMRFDWHIAGADQDVSPHCDDAAKVGTHLIYFNSSTDWRPEWGGATIFLGGKKTSRMNPELSEFAEHYQAPMLDNQSTIFRNSSEAWHGVDRIACPQGHYRRLFCVVFHRPGRWPRKLLRPVVRRRNRLGGGSRLGTA